MNRTSLPPHNIMD